MGIDLCVVTSHSYTSVYFRIAAALLRGRKCIAVIERKVLIVSLFANASDYSNNTCIHWYMCLYLTKYASLVGVVTCVREERYDNSTFLSITAIPYQYRRM